MAEARLDRFGMDAGPAQTKREKYLTTQAYIRSVRTRQCASVCLSPEGAGKNKRNFLA
jgi:hypothetical protein